MQPPFSKSSLFNALALAGLILGAQAGLRALRPPLDLSPATATIAWDKVDLPRLSDHRVRFGGAWTLRSSDPRAGGFSGLAVDRGRLLALTDSGLVVWLPFPSPRPASAAIRALPAVAGDPKRKLGRDSEALAWDGSGWWVAFEQRHQAIRYDRDLRRALQRIAVRGDDFRANRGVEALTARPMLRAYSESSGTADATVGLDGRTLLLKRRIGLGGFRASIAGVDGGEIELPLAPLDNAEGLAAQRLADGRFRLWVITDNDHSRWRRTLLVAVDVAATARD